MSSGQPKTNMARYADEQRRTAERLGIDRRWQIVDGPFGQTEYRLRLSQLPADDLRLLILPAPDGSYQVGALTDRKQVWATLSGGSLTSAEQCAFDCYTSLVLLERVRTMPLPARPRTRRAVRKAVRFWVRNALRWMCAAIGAVIAALVIAVWVLAISVL